MIIGHRHTRSLCKMFLFYFVKKACYWNTGGMCKTITSWKVVSTMPEDKS
jgi:hypothetical protein